MRLHIDLTNGNQKSTEAKTRSKKQTSNQGRVQESKTESKIDTIEAERQHFRAKEAGEDGQHSEGLEILYLKKSPGSRLPATKPPVERREGEAARTNAILGSGAPPLPLPLPPLTSLYC